MILFSEPPAIQIWAALALSSVSLAVFVHSYPYHDESLNSLEHMALMTEHISFFFAVGVVGGETALHFPQFCSVVIVLVNVAFAVQTLRMARNRCRITRICRKYDDQLKRMTKRITHIWWNENPLVKQAKQVELSEHRTGNGGKGATDKAASDGQKTTGVNKVDTEEIVCEVLI